jgi:hypothetical protein
MQNLQYMIDSAAVDHLPDWMRAHANKEPVRVCVGKEARAETRREHCKPPPGKYKLPPSSNIQSKYHNPSEHEKRGRFFFSNFIHFGPYKESSM